MIVYTIDTPRLVREQGLCNGSGVRPSVRLQRRGGHEIKAVDRLLQHARRAADDGAQQQMRAVARCQQT